MSHDSPFERPPVMRGYPLDPVEKAALEHALHEIEDAQSNGSAKHSTPPARRRSPRRQPQRTARHQ
jgi:hypothetical protein